MPYISEDVIAMLCLFCVTMYIALMLEHMACVMISCCVSSGNGYPSVELNLLWMKVYAM